MNNNFTQLIQYDVSELVMTSLEMKASTLHINGVNDKDNYELVDKTRKEAKKLKIEVENRRKELKADALTFGRLVDDEAAKYFDRLLKIEKQLEVEQKRIDDEKEKIKLEKEQEAKLPNRKILLSEFIEGVPSDEEIKVLSDLDFQALIQKLVAGRQAKIQEEQRIERENIEREKRKIIEEQMEQRRKINEEQERLSAEKNKLELERDKLNHLQKEPIITQDHITTKVGDVRVPAPAIISVNNINKIKCPYCGASFIN